MDRGWREVREEGTELQAEQPGKKKERKVIPVRKEEVRGSVCR